MFERELARLRSRLEVMGSRNENGQPHLNFCATIEQIEEYEGSLGVALPEQYREFILQVGDGFMVGHQMVLWLAPLFSENSSMGKGKVADGLLVFPSEECATNKAYYFNRWEDLRGHEKMEKHMGLCVGSWSSQIFMILALNGPDQGKFWLSKTWKGVSDPSGLPFFDALEQMLDQTK